MPITYRHPNYYAEMRKLQAPSSFNNEPQASSPKQKGSSFKPEASSAKIPEPGNN